MRNDNTGQIGSKGAIDVLRTIIYNIHLHQNNIFLTSIF